MTISNLLADEILYELTSCGISGSEGPTSADCRTGHVSKHRIEIEGGVQTVTIERNGTYEITGITIVTNASVPNSISP